MRRDRGSGGVGLWWDASGSASCCGRIVCKSAQSLDGAKGRANQERCSCDNKRSFKLLMHIRVSRVWLAQPRWSVRNRAALLLAYGPALPSLLSLRPPLLSFIPPLTYQGSPRQQPRPRRMQSSFSCWCCAKGGSVVWESGRENGKHMEGRAGHRLKIGCKHCWSTATGACSP